MSELTHRTRRLRMLGTAAALGLVAAASAADLSSPAGAPPSWTAARTPVLEPFAGTTGLSAASCGSCHPDIYAEWKSSTHAHAWVDPQFQAELAKDPEVAWLCINCHTPLANQQARLHTATDSIRAPQVQDNPHFDAELQQEGVTCLTCHWRPEGIAAVHEDVQAPHPTVHVPELRESTTCTGCHQAVARLEDALVCAFNTGAEWAEAQPGKSCPECHMPAQHRPSAVGGPARAGGRHTWPGSLIPKDRPSEEEQELMAADWAPGVDLTLSAPSQAAPGEPITVTLTVTNARAGHRVPTGDPERYLEVGLRLRDPTGRPLTEESVRIGQRWEWWPVARKLSDNRLAPGESRSVSMDLTLPAQPGRFEASAWVDHVRMSPENAAHHDLTDYPTRRRVHSRQAVILVGGASPTPAP